MPVVAKFPEEFTSLSPWIDGRTSRTPFHRNTIVTLDMDHMGFIALDRVVFVHEVADLKAQSLAAAWHAAHAYVAEACEIVGAPNAAPLLDSEEIEMIRDRLGPPPAHCYPLYFISVSDQTTGLERLVYIGKTSSSKNRFSGGHAALTKLHHPDYDGLEKRLYTGAIQLVDKQAYTLPLEAIRPLKDAEQLLRSVEAQLIFQLRPELNIQARNRNLSRLPLDFHIQNFVSDFLIDRMIFKER